MNTILKSAFNVDGNRDSAHNLHSLFVEQHECSSLSASTVYIVTLMQEIFCIDCFYSNMNTVHNLH